MKLIQRLKAWSKPPEQSSWSRGSPDEGMLASLLSMAYLVEAHDPYTGGHLWRVSQYCYLLAETAGLSPDEARLIALGGFVHDLGKIGIPSAVLRKPGPLSDDEYQIIKTHPAIGKRLAENHPLAELVMDAIWAHHETPDGRGYPRGLTGEKISQMAAITGICDAFDAMTSHRPYRKGMPVDEAIRALEDGAGGQFHHDYALLFAEIARGGRLQHVLGHTDEGIPVRHCASCGPTITISRVSEAGDVVYCPACEMGYALYETERGEPLDVRPTGIKGTAQQLAPVIDVDMIARSVKRLSAHGPA